MGNENVATGMITKGIGGFYRIVLDDGRYLRCRMRGRLRKGDVRPLAGDRVVVRLPAREGGDGVIERILPRRTQLVRPPIANVDQVVVVLACAEPDPDRYYLDRLLLAILSEGMRPVLCMNKVDLRSPDEAREWMEPYRDVVDATLPVSARQGWGIQELAAVLRDRISTMAGPSGVGKSALLNAIYPAFERQTGDVSARLGRGRHTTRAVELLPLPGGGWIADTPGFSQIDVSNLEPEEVERGFPDLARYASGCRFPGCAHLKEPDCAVREAAATGQVPSWRYRHYTIILEEVQEARARQYR